MPVFSDYLRRFNRKERFFLIGWSLGNPEFELSSDFRHSVSSAIGLAVPPEAFVAMDYHLDWLYASAVLASRDEARGIHDNGEGQVKGNQEDIDLLIAFERDTVGHVIMVEAKGVTNWTNKQMSSKARRLEGIFGWNGERWPSIRPHFILTSPKESQGLNCATWPGWMRREDGRPYWMRMEIPKDLMRITRCDEAGRVSAEGGHWKTVRRSARRDVLAEATQKMMPKEATNAAS